MKKPTIIKSVSLAICITLSVLSFSGVLAPVTNFLGSKALAERNDKYLNDTFNKTLVSFGVLSTFKAGLAIVEGSSIGVSAIGRADVPIGDAVRPVYRYVNIAWRTLLTGCITLLSMQYLLKAAGSISNIMLGITLFFLGISLCLRWWGGYFIRMKDVVRDMLSVSIVALIALLYILPISIWGASRLSQVITAPSIAEAQEGYAEIQEEFAGIQGIMLPGDDTASDGLMRRIRDLPERIREIMHFLQNRATDMAVWTIRLITGYIFDCIIFPLTLFLLLLWLTKSVMRYVFQKNMQSSIREDLRRILVEGRLIRAEGLNSD